MMLHNLAPILLVGTTLACGPAHTSWFTETKHQIGVATAGEMPQVDIHKIECATDAILKYWGLHQAYFFGLTILVYPETVKCGDVKIAHGCFYGNTFEIEMMWDEELVPNLVTHELMHAYLYLEGINDPVDHSNATYWHDGGHWPKILAKAKELCYSIE